MSNRNAKHVDSGRRGTRRWIIVLALLTWATWLLGQFLRDCTLLTSFFFYIPSPILVVLMSGCAFYAWLTRGRRVAGVLLCLALVPAVFVIFIENHFFTGRPDDSDADTLRLVHWNVFRGHMGWEEIVADLRQREPDLCVLSEIPIDADIPSTAASFGEDYCGVQFGNLAVIARGTLLDGTWLQRGGGVMAYGVRWQSPQGSCRVLVVDLAANLSLAREPRLLAIQELMVDWEADVVVGDFNAPRRSRALSSLPSGYVHAYDAAGSGYSYTWPMPCPVYAIDQCIVGQRVRPEAYALENSWRSDHRRQVLDFTLQSP